MKKVINYVTCLVAATAMTQAINAQELKSKDDQYNPRGPLTADTTMNQRMQKDLSNRNSLPSNQAVVWKENGVGYYGTYSINNQEYKARYDQDGKYVETLTKKDWKENAPSNLKASFNRSSYKSQKITSYWEVNNLDRKGYYLELNNDQNHPTGIWADEDGIFSSSPSYVKYSPKKTKNMMLIKDSTLNKDH